jgi:drug/metabolite transporter (DMT)-like permease
MHRLQSSPVALLLVTGLLLGMTLPFGRIATDAGVSPMVWAFIISAGAGGVLAATLLASGVWVRPTGAKLRYFALTALISYTIPNLLMFTVIPRVGAGYTGVMFTLSPIFTLVFSLITGIRRPNLLGMAGIGVGFVGAVMVAITRGEAGAPAEFFWVSLALAIPVFLAVGNIYRTWGWPEGAGATELAAGSHLASAAILLALILGTGSFGEFAALSAVPLTTVLQMASSAAMFFFFFRLQAVGGPVYLSQMGYVAAAFGLVVGTLFLGERYLALTWIGAGVLAVGVVLASLAQSRR